MTDEITDPDDIDNEPAPEVEDTTDSLDHGKSKRPDRTTGENGKFGIGASIEKTGNKVSVSVDVHWFNGGISPFLLGLNALKGMA